MTACIPYEQISPLRPRSEAGDFESPGGERIHPYRPMECLRLFWPFKPGASGFCPSNWAKRPHLWAPRETSFLKRGPKKGEFPIVAGARESWSGSSPPHFHHCPPEFLTTVLNKPENIRIGDNNSYFDQGKNPPSSKTRLRGATSSQFQASFRVQPVLWVAD